MKKIYKKPSLEMFGTVQNITQAGSPGNADTITNGSVAPGGGPFN